MTTHEKSNPRKRALPLVLVFSTLVAGILIGTVISGSVDAAPEAEEPVTDATPLVVPEAVPVDNQFSVLARKVRPSVVSIYIPASVEVEQSQNEPFFNNPEDMFRRFFGMPNAPGEAPRRRGPGQGSGVIVDSKGYIITNNHVVEGADRIQVMFVDDEERYDAKLIGVDAETDLAVIHVPDKKSLEAARIGNSDATSVGDWAIAIGSPFGYRETVTVGIISAKSREMHEGDRSRPFRKFLQTDAAINPGNSGGPLVNVRGEVIGINTAIISRTGGYDGIGFALASNIAVQTYNQIIRFGRVSRGSIGVHFSDDNPSLSRSYGAEGGVFVLRTVEDGPAEEAGMKAEDIIVSVDGIKIDNGEKLIEVVAAITVGEKVQIEVIRRGEKLTLDVKIADRLKLYPEQAEAPSEEPQEAESASVRFGITVQEISPDRRDAMRLPGDGGILVTKVEPGSFAEKIEIRSGDVIVAVNRVEIASTRELRNIQRSLTAGTDVAFKVLRSTGRDWRTVYLAGLLPE